MINRGFNAKILIEQHNYTRDVHNNIVETRSYFTHAIRLSIRRFSLIICIAKV